MATAYSDRAELDIFLSVATGRHTTKKCKLCRTIFKGRRNSIFHTETCRYRYHNLIKKFGLNKTDGMLRELERLGELPPKEPIRDK